MCVYLSVTKAKEGKKGEKRKHIGANSDTHGR